MATISNQTLALEDLVENGIKKVRVEVKYDVVFTPTEELLQNMLGFKFQEFIQILGVDTGNPIDQILLEFMPIQNIQIPGAGVTISRKRVGKMTRDSLQEDPAPGDADEIRCEIKILPVAATEFTPVVQLAG